MREEKKKKRGRVPFFSSIQMKYAMSYLAIVSVVLILLNTKNGGYATGCRYR